MTTINLFLDHPTPRVIYSLEQVFLEILGWNLSVNPLATNSIEDVTLFYGTKPTNSDSLFQQIHPIMLETKIKEQRMSFFEFNDIPVFFGITEPQSIFPFDPFAMIFYLLSRYEEYLPFEADKHGRFPASSSLAFRQKFLDKPIVNYLVNQIYNRLRKLYPHIERKDSKPSLKLTFDIDMAFAFRNKPFTRILGGTLKDLVNFEFVKLYKRIKAFLDSSKDPFYQFELMQELTNNLGIDTIYFLQVGKHGKFDKNNPIEQPAIKKLFRDISHKNTIGIHPSYASNYSAEFLKAEKNTLESVTGKLITKSRQHYLKVIFPDTYENILSNDITDEFSLGYAEYLGFRASIAQKYKWFNLKLNQGTDLYIHPFQIMDVTLNTYLGLSKHEIWEHILPILDEVKNVNGELVIIWHNSSLSEMEQWVGWRQLFQELIPKISKYLKN